MNRIFSLYLLFSIPKFHGDRCNTSAPITFGYDSSSTCTVRHKSLNCTQTKMMVENYFDNLIQGTYLAPYSRFEPPYLNPVPVLRNFEALQINETYDPYTKTCKIPIGQRIMIQYTSITSKSGNLIHRIIGMRTDRHFQNSTWWNPISLTSQIIFVFVSSTETEPLSRFWENVYSPERSENAWLNIFNAFDDEVTGDELKEMTFWCTALVLSIFLWFLLPKQRTQ